LPPERHLNFQVIGNSSAVQLGLVLALIQIRKGGLNAQGKGYHCKRHVPESVGLDKDDSPFNVPLPKMKLELSVLLGFDPVYSVDTQIASKKKSDISVVG
jgi:hypothetical protein